VRRGETEYGVGAIPLGGYVRITGMNPDEDIPPDVAPRAYYNQAVWKRIVVISAGPLMNVLVAFVIFWGLLVFSGFPAISPVVDRIDKGTPAAGQLQRGDRILAIDGRSGEVDVFARQIARHRCPARSTVDGCRAATPAKVTLERDGQRLTLPLRPFYDADAKRSRLGFAFGIEKQREGVLAGVDSSISAMWRVTKATGSALVRLVYDPDARKQVSGVVGSYETTRQTIKHSGPDYVMQILAIISLSLAIVNLFPFLPLDGGHIFWAVAEKLRGRPVPFSVMERASVVGFFLVIMLFAIGLTNDIDRLRGEGFAPP